MRVIKFRAFSKIFGTNKMCYDVEMMLKTDGTWWVCNEGKHIFNQSSNRGHIMQFTGLHDKHGKEIYEMDIVKHKNGIQIVKWDNESASFQMCLNNSVLDQEINNYEDVEIIGNVHQNPELINT